MFYLNFVLCITNIDSLARFKSPSIDSSATVNYPVDSLRQLESSHPVDNLDRDKSPFCYIDLSHPADGQAMLKSPSRQFN